MIVKLIAKGVELLFLGNRMQDPLCEVEINEPQKKG